MSCKQIRMKDGSVVLVNVKSGTKLTTKDERILAEWVQFCRDRRARGRKMKSEPAYREKR